VEIFVEEDMVILKKHQPSCLFCGDPKDVISFKGHNICPNCLRELTK